MQDYGLLRRCLAMTAWDSSLQDSALAEYWCVLHKQLTRFEL
ncbi:hypothetical protein [Helicobacter sp.]|nr:hypothetical protein [Helicobacter sp.]MDY5557430.1 hypothetical protein [Helicobacter sp.]